MDALRKFSITLWALGMLLPGILMTLVAVVVIPGNEWGNWITFGLGLPVAVLALKNVRWSAAGFLLLLLLDVFATSWPHINMGAAFFHSAIDLVLLEAAVMGCMLAVFLPRGGLIRNQPHPPGATSR